MRKIMLLLLWFFSGPVWTSVIKHSTWYECNPRTWLDAREHCRSVNNGDLATVTETEVDQMNMEKFYAWIGLRKHDSKWYWDKDNTAFQERQHNFITPSGNKECGKALFKNSRPLSEYCEKLHFFFCRYFEDDNQHDVLIPKTKSWDEAKQYCVNNYHEFITVTHDNDLHFGSSPFYVSRDFPVWIGRYQEGNSWQWANGNYKNWAAGSGPDVCGIVWSQNKTWSSENCSEAFPSLCYTHNLVLVQELFTWEQAFLHCMTLSAPPGQSYSSYQLLSVDPQDLKFAHLYLHAHNATTDKVWLALRFIGESWFWSNGEALTLPDLPLCPAPNLHCGALVVNRNTLKPTIEPTDCSDTLNVLCYGL